ncbi:class I SAM-dependent methyltransferase [Paenibacillus sp. CGMCC 1.18879]|uniref:class I SAM-dependent methyltransferase n=1 Tax=Paenibacillus sp. CGMCC 1.18879 TaxID=2834466 RepID=UPI001CA8D558|nr:class I SAM-dependent methyltransferase [Paenibacillus sp. CGMCC 1.18879]MBY9077524.1 class I SAM-dependent methyltransferase [Paenibacillus sp. CGMCC 1.18879]
MEYTGERFVLGKAEGEIEVEHLHRYNAILDLVSGKKVLDIACGEGFGTAILARKATDIWGVDISQEAISYASEKYKRYNLKYQQGSIESLDFVNDFFDIIVSFETIEHVEEVVQDKFLKEASRVLKDEGILVISTPDKYLYTDLPKHQNPYHLKEFYFSEYKDFLEKQFKYVEFYNQNFGEYGLLVKRNENSDEQIRLINTALSQREGKYIVAVCSNKELPQTLAISSLFENKITNEPQNNTEDDFAQLYWLNGEEGFNESNSKKIKFSYGEEFQTYCFTVPSTSLGNIRLDIGNNPAVFEIKKDIIIKYNDTALIRPIEIVDSLGVIELAHESNTLQFISMSKDPQLILEGLIPSHDGELSIYIEMKVSPFDYNDCLEKINDYLKKLRTSSSVEIETEKAVESDHEQPANIS